MKDTAGQDGEPARAGQSFLALNCKKADEKILDCVQRPVCRSGRICAAPGHRGPRYSRRPLQCVS
ncbi:MAG: hypothetical protein OJF61_001666 [Rhodanobacteraceae bacterium]|nr:MAG: hypothetical protein OJF61_001666 [Rhodanobacteraceae bacterium]